MSGTIHAVLIDPFAQTVTNVRIPNCNDGPAQWEAMKVLMKCEWLEHVDLGAGQSLWVDEEGFRMPWDQQRFFSTRNAHTGELQGQAMAGRALVTGRTGPEVTGARVGAAAVAPLIVWTPGRQVVIPAATIASAEFGPDGRLRPIETPQPLDGDRRTYSYHDQPRPLKD